MPGKSNTTRISNPEDLDKTLKRTNPVVWIVLWGHIVVLLIFYLWASFATIEQKVEMTAVVSNDRISVYDREGNIDRIAAGQKIYIKEEAGTILSVSGDGTVRISGIAPEDGVYRCSIVIREIRPIEFLFNE